jgi:hypothetical protein
LNPERELRARIQSESELLLTILLPRSLVNGFRIKRLSMPNRRLRI